MRNPLNFKSIQWNHLLAFLISWDYPFKLIQNMDGSQTLWHKPFNQRNLLSLSSTKRKVYTLVPPWDWAMAWHNINFNQEN
jgi:hypothetical protein